MRKIFLTDVGGPVRVAAQALIVISGVGIGLGIAIMACSLAGCFQPRSARVCLELAGADGGGVDGSR